MFSRHDLAWLSGAGWDAVRARALPGQHAAIAQWQREDWPAIVRRVDAGLAAGQVGLGIALPPAPDGTKGRISLHADGADIARTTPALSLADAVLAAPPCWRAALVAMALESDDIVLRAYGSLAMQALTRQPYLTAASDIDLLLIPANLADLRAGLALLTRHAELLPLDGEIVFPNGAAVAWKEWRDAEGRAARVLVKQAGGVRLMAPAQLLATLEDA
ncbi:MAG: malonate decarboxylase holo-[acyl-carrier-protein] synthase [Pseudomonadota bacterium]|nr:malonate decarboxylase holo-[acyl-carrier-protein] synthase [Pseudomonadota bacterium]